ncbi:uncharacterized protein LOC144119911 [Amblyomma americanum]
MAQPAPLPPFAAAGAPVPAGGIPGGPLGPDDEMDPIQMEMMLQQAMYDLMQRPIIPDSLAFVCAALYLIIVMTLLIAGAFYFTNRLQPPPPPTPPEETETTAIYTEPPQETTAEELLWSTISQDNNPYVCLIGLQNKNQVDLVDSLNALCSFIAMKENLDSDNGDIVLQGKRHSNDEIRTIFETEYADKRIVAVGILCCTLVYNYDFLDGDSPFADSHCKIKLQPNITATALHNYLVSLTCENVLLEIGEATEEEVIRLAPLLRGHNVIAVLFAPTPMTQEALAKRRMSLLPNNFQALTAGDGKALAAARKHAKKVCVMFTVAALKSTGVAKSSANPVNQPATSVVAVHQSVVCQLAGLIYDKPSMSYYRKGNDMLSIDKPETLAKKVKTLLKANPDICVGAYDVQFDDCNITESIPLTKTTFRVFNKELRRR